MLQKREKVWKYRVNIPHILRTEHNCTRSTNSFIFEQSPPPRTSLAAPHTTGGKYPSTVLAFQSKTTRDMLSISKHREAALLLTSRVSSCISIIFSSPFLSVNGRTFDGATNGCSAIFLPPRPNGYNSIINNH